MAAGVRAATLHKLHQCLVRRKYRALFSARRSRRRPGPKGPSEELVRAIVDIERRNPLFGCPRIALIISTTFGVEVDKDVVRRVLEKHLRPGSGGGGPSWLTVIGHAKDSLWSVELFRCESILLKTHWVLVVMVQFTRRIIGFAVHVGNVDGLSLCRRFNRVISRHAEGSGPTSSSIDGSRTVAGSVNSPSWPRSYPFATDRRRGSPAPENDG